MMEEEVLRDNRRAHSARWRGCSRDYRVAKKRGANRLGFYVVIAVQSSILPGLARVQTGLMNLPSPSASGIAKSQADHARMKIGDLLSRLVLLAVLACNALVLWPELSVSRVDLNDNVAHFALVERMTLPDVNPLDSWSPEWSFGYPMLRVYQSLSHGMVAAVYFLLGKTVPLL